MTTDPAKTTAVDDSCPMCEPGKCPGGAHRNALAEDGIHTREQYAALKATAVDDARIPDESSVAFLHAENRTLRSTIERIEAKCHPLDCGHCSCALEGDDHGHSSCSACKLGQEREAREKLTVLYRRQADTILTMQEVIDTEPFRSGPSARLLRQNAQLQTTISTLTAALERATKILQAWADNDVVSDDTLMEMTDDVIPLCIAALAQKPENEPGFSTVTHWMPLPEPPK